MTSEELVEEFSLFDDWHDRFQYIVELGDQLDPLPDEYRIDENLVQGCQSNVWLVARVRDAGGADASNNGSGDGPVIDIVADSDSQIVRGLIAILIMLMSGRTPAEIQQVDVESLFQRLELQRHLSRSRSNGLHSMVQRIRQLAGDLAA